MFGTFLAATEAAATCLRQKHWVTYRRPLGTEAADINDSEQIVGSYDFTDPDHPLEGAHGFLLSGGVFRD